MNLVISGVFCRKEEDEAAEHPGHDKPDRGGEAPVFHQINRLPPSPQMSEILLHLENGIGIACIGAECQKEFLERGVSDLLRDVVDLLLRQARHFTAQELPAWPRTRPHMEPR